MNNILLIFLIILSIIIIYFLSVKIFFIIIKHNNIKKIYNIFLKNNLKIININNEKILNYNKKVYKIHLINLYKNKRLVINSKKIIEIFSNKKPLLYHIDLDNKYTNLVITYGSTNEIKRYINELEMIVCKYNEKYEDSYYTIKNLELDNFIKEVIINDF